MSDHRYKARLKEFQIAQTLKKAESQQAESPNSRENHYSSEHYRTSLKRNLSKLSHSPTVKMQSLDIENTNKKKLQLLKLKFEELPFVLRHHI